jgi:sensor histidine kinase regulating citrate/malate metabolism
VQFEIAALNSFADHFESTISLIKLQTVLADLIDNAINATSQSKIKRVLIIFDVNDGVLELQVQVQEEGFHKDFKEVAG